MLASSIVIALLCATLYFQRVACKRSSRQEPATPSVPLAPTVSFSDQGKQYRWLDVEMPDIMNLLPMDTSGTGPPPCLTNESELGYVQNSLSATQTFYNCLNNVPDAAMIATFYNAQYNGQLRINTSITLNNLEYVNEIEGTARLQFSMRLFWQDDRFAMPVFWNKTSPLTQAYGIDLTTILLNDSIIVWQPQIRFPDAADLNIMVSYLKLNSSNIFEWGAAIDATLLQPKFDFSSYPADEQVVNIRYIVFNMRSEFCVLGFYGGQSLKFNENYDGSNTFTENPIWHYVTTTWSNFEGNGFTYALYQIQVKREGQGIVLRLVLPITLLLVLAGLTFWVTYENRVDTTITLLLSISALYIVILTNIPLVGYLTNVDKYVFWVSLPLFHTRTDPNLFPPYLHLFLSQSLTLFCVHRCSCCS